MNLKGRLLRFRSFWIFPSLAAAAIVLSKRHNLNSNFADLLWLFPLGLLLWTFLEYTLHRFVFHMESEGLHSEHHRRPRDSDFILVPPELAILISAGVAALILSLARNFFVTSGILAGIWAGFLYYEVVHYRVHVGNATGAGMALQRRHHFHHHFRNSSRCYGVTTPLWDYIFRTNSK